MGLTPAATLAVAAGPVAEYVTAAGLVVGYSLAAARALIAEHGEVRKAKKAQFYFLYGTNAAIEQVHRSRSSSGPRKGQQQAATEAKKCQTRSRPNQLSRPVRAIHPEGSLPRAGVSAALTWRCRAGCTSSGWCGAGFGPSAIQEGRGFAGAALQRGARRLRPGCWLGPARLAGAEAETDGSAGG